MSESLFLISPIGGAGTPIRHRADDLLEFVVRPAATTFDLEVLRADHDVKPGSITRRIVESIVEARVVVADLTGPNANVFYELGIAHAYERPTIIMIDDPGNLPFDTVHERVIAIHDSGVISASQADEAKRALTAALEVVLADGYRVENMLTGIAAARRLDEIAPDNPIAATLADLRDEVEAMKHYLSRTEDPADVRARMIAATDRFRREVIPAFKPLVRSLVASTEPLVMDSQVLLGVGNEAMRAKVQQHSGEIKRVTDSILGGDREILVVTRTSLA